MSHWRVLLGGTLIDGKRHDPVDDAAVVIEGDRVRYAGPRAGARWPDDAVVQDTTGMTMMPGLIDAHDHLAHTGLDFGRRAAMPYSLVVYEAAQTLEQTLKAGFTTVRDAAGLDLGAKLAVERGIVRGPRLQISLVILCPTAGLGSFSSPSGLQFPPTPGIPNGMRNGPDDCRLGVREVIAAGTDIVKIATTGGIGSMFQSPIDRQFTDEETFALVDEAHYWGKPVMCHAYGGPGARAAILAGADTIEHGSFLYQDEDLLRHMAAEGLWLVPTLSVIEAHVNLGNPTHSKKASGIMEHTHRTIARAAELGVRMAMGTDAGAYGHGNNARELQLLVEAGLSPMQAIIASTSDAADCIGMGKEVGSLEPDKLADVLVVDGNPLTDMTMLMDTDRIALVLKGGEAFVDRVTVA
jgi:imidazolonepropionase-like amidohydrolase